MTDTPAPAVSAEGLVERLMALPVRTLIVNVDTGEEGPQSIGMSLAFRDELAAALRGAK